MAYTKLVKNFFSTRSNRMYVVDSSWNVMAQGDAREGTWRGNWRMEWVASTLHSTSEHGVSSITTADAHTSAASSRLNWHPRRFKWTRPFRWKTKSGFCACAITFQTQSTTERKEIGGLGGVGKKGRLTMQLNWTVTIGPEERCILCVDGKLA